MHQLLCLIHIIHRHVYNVFDDGFANHLFSDSKHLKNLRVCNADNLTELVDEFSEQQISMGIAKPPAFMSIYKILKFKMKVAYERWLLNLKMGRLLHLAIYQTIV